MKAENFDLAAYLRRIGLEGTTPGSGIETVTSLMRHQLFSVPFENLDVQSGKGVSLVPEDIARKILQDGRGGYCYEVNGIFAMALDAIGVAYQFVAARPMFYPARRPRTHMAVVAIIDEIQWLCDLGFGSYGPRAPVRLDRLDIAIEQDCDTFMVTRDTNGDFILKALVENEWVNQYGFDLSRQEWIDFYPANHLNSTHPDAIFVQKMLVIQHTPTGRVILLGSALKTINEGVVTKKSLSEAERSDVLKSAFGLSPVLSPNP